MFGQVLVDRAKLAARLANCLVDRAKPAARLANCLLDRLACLADATHQVAQSEAKSKMHTADL